MKTKYPSMFGLLAVFMLVASLVVPANLVSPTSVDADPGICKWDTLAMPGSVVGKNDILNPAGTGNEIIAMSEMGSNGSTMLAIVRDTGMAPWFVPVGNHLYVTATGGIIWSTVPGNHLMNEMVRVWPGVPAGELFAAAIAPDDPNFWAVVSSRPDVGLNCPLEVWVTENAGATWEMTDFYTAAGAIATEFISAIDISMDYGGKRDIAVGIRKGVNANNASLEIWVVQSAGYSGWNMQTVLPNEAAAAGLNHLCDVLDLEFSPTYVGDASLAVVFSVDPTAALPANDATYFNVAFRDLSQNDISPGGWAYAASVEVRDPAGAAGDSPDMLTIVSADLELPSDFSGQAASLRRAYVSLDTSIAAPAATDQAGIYRIDDTTPYELMDTSTIAAKRINSIAYYGTYASGKLLAGERLGFACTATVPTWFTDSPTTCPIPCWYPALKPTTGAAAGAWANCAIGNQAGQGNAQVFWNPDGSLALVGTGALGLRAITVGALTWFGLLLGAVIPDDESAFAISRNNGETWNQLGLIDTTPDWFNDMAVAPDCTTLYLASVSTSANNTDCRSFDSVWRTSINSAVLSPLPNWGSIGAYYERVYCRVTNLNCTMLQTNRPLLRLAPDKTDGEIVGWAAQNTRAQAWSPDFGDYWANISSRNAIQDFAFESSTILYDLSPGGLVQKLPYTGTAWSSAEPDVNTAVSGAHSIAAQPEGKVIVGAAGWYNAAAYPGALTTGYDAAASPFATMFDALPTVGNVHVAFDPAFDDNNQYFVADDSGTGTVYRMTFMPGFGVAEKWENTDMMAVVNGAIGCNAPHAIGQFGLQLAATGADDQHALYSAHAAAGAVAAGAAIAEQVLMTVTAAPAAGLANAEVVTLTTNLVAATVMPALPILSPVGTFVVSPVATITAVTAAVAAPSTATGAVSLTGVTTGADYGTLDLFTNTFVAGPGQVPAAAVIANAGVCRTLWPLDGMPKPGIVWDCLNTFVNPPAAGVAFTLEPWSLKKCGCLTMDTDTILWAIDDETGGLWNTALGYNPGANQGMVWGFSDCMAKAGPTLITEDGMLVGCDPVSGRNQEVNFCWEQLCVANAYDIEIAKNEDFSIRVIDWVGDGNTTGAACVGFLAPVDIMTPCVFFPAGGASAPYVHASEIAQWGNLECGHTYYWRVQVRSCATTQQIRSPWSEVRSFTIKAGLPVRADYYGLKLLAPDNGCLGCAVSPASFSWAPFKGTTSYKFVLAKDAALTDVIAEGEVATTAYEYDGTLDYSTNYFWRVMCLEPAPSDWSATFSFQTEAAPEAPPAAPDVPTTPLWVWVVIAIGAILVIVTLVLIFKTRRV